MKLSPLSAPPVMGPVPRLVTGRKPSGYRVVAKGDAAEIYLYGVIGQDWFGDGISAKQFADDLKSLGAVKTVDLRINSEGGDVFAGKAMYTLLVEHAATIIVHIDGLAASAASYIAMAGDEIEIAEAAFVMIHNAAGGCFGGADDMRRCANLLDTVDGTIRDVYAARTKQSVATIKKWMDDETWMTGREAVEKGFADRIVANLAVAASLRDPAKFRHAPAALRPRRVAALAAIAGQRAALRHR
jgi:ATP-dependent Clp protease, protease subunit